jgi:hypothetical protein
MISFGCSGFRILVSVADLEFSEIKKICQQYMKFESVVERIIPHVEIKDAYSRHHNDWDVCILPPASSSLSILTYVMWCN